MKHIVKITAMLLIGGFLYGSHQIFIQQHREFIKLHDLQYDAQVYELEANHQNLAITQGSVEFVKRGLILQDETLFGGLLLIVNVLIICAIVKAEDKIVRTYN